ncbi:DDE-type integrase/transposase/recombinase [Sphingomonas sp. R86521]|uniref:DDE-type integrase/transposase/recombinase n=1 Tax=Sphingomonas sp. R86521 TaxID=3093860 RepID=UPI0036D43D45
MEGPAGAVNAPPAQTRQSVSLLQLVPGGDPAGSADVPALPPVAQERRGPAVRARIDIYHETVRTWWNRFGLLFEGDVRRQRVSRMWGFHHWHWHMDETYVKLNGEMVYLSRTVDYESEILKGYATRRRDKDVALTVMKKALRRHGLPDNITTNGLRS